MVKYGVRVLSSLQRVPWLLIVCRHWCMGVVVVRGGWFVGSIVIKIGDS